MIDLTRMMPRRMKMYQIVIDTTGDIATGNITTGNLITGDITTGAHFRFRF